MHVHVFHWDDKHDMVHGGTLCLPCIHVYVGIWLVLADFARFLSQPFTQLAKFVQNVSSNLSDSHQYVGQFSKIIRMFELDKLIDWESRSASTPFDCAAHEYIRPKQNFLGQLQCK